MAVAEGTLIANRYRLTSRLTSRGAGTAWAAEDVDLSVTVAATQVELDPDATPEERQTALAGARAECQRTACLRSHPNVGTVHDVVEHTDGRLWMIADPVAGRSLADILATGGPVDVPTARRIAVAVLSALTAAHAKGIVHRDLTPSSIMVADDGQVVLTGFGVARRADGAPMTSSGMPVDTMPYIAPERFAGVITPAGDVFALGVTLYQALEGTFTPAPPMNAGDLEPLLRVLLIKDPTARITAATALAVALGTQATMTPMPPPWGMAAGYPYHRPPPFVGARVPRAPRHPRLEVYWRFVVPSALMVALVVLAELPTAAATFSWTNAKPNGDSGQVVRSMHDLLSPNSTYDGGGSPLVTMAIVLAGAASTITAIMLQRPGVEPTVRVLGYLGVPVALADFSHQLSMVTTHGARLFPVHYDYWWGEQTSSTGPAAWLFYAVLVALGMLHLFRDIVERRRAGQRWPVRQRTWPYPFQTRP